MKFKGIGLILLVSCMLMGMQPPENPVSKAVVDPASSADVEKVLPNDDVSVMILLDASNSMAQHWDGYRKYSVATDLLTNMIDYYYRKYPNIHFAIRLFGNSYDMKYDRCDDTELVADFDERNVKLIAKNLRSETPRGWSPIQYSMEQALKDFKGNTSMTKKLILISDGGETCQGDPCSLERLIKQHGVDVEPFIVGLSKNMYLYEDLSCIGDYRQAASTLEFNQALYDIVEEFMKRTTVQFYYTDSEKSYQNTEINMSFSNMKYTTGDELYVHALKDNVSDTMEVLSQGIYKLTAHTFPPIVVEDIELIRMQHNIVEVDAREGDLEIEAFTGRGFANYDCIVKDSKTGEIINVQQIGESKKYLTGVYDVEITTRPKTIFKDVEIKHEELTKLRVKRSGSFLFENREEIYGTLYSISDDNKIEEVFIFDDLFGRRRVDILSGKYQFVYRLKDAKQEKTITEEFEILAGNVYHSIIEK